MTLAGKKIPRRTCVACRSVAGKRTLTRVVRRPDGAVVVDPSGRLPGRGAYICPRLECWQKSIACLERALNIRLTSEAKDRLLLQGKELLEEE